MNIASRITHEIRRAAGDTCHYAKVTVSSDKKCQTVDAPNVWILAAQNGIDFAIKLTKSTQQIYLVSIQGSDTDTREDTVFAASTMATLRLLGCSQYCEQFRSGQWEIGLVDGDDK